MTVPYGEGAAASPRRDPPRDKDPYAPRKPPHDRHQEDRYHDEPMDHPRRDHPTRHYARGSDRRLSPQRHHPRDDHHYPRDRDQPSPSRPDHQPRDPLPPHHAPDHPSSPPPAEHMPHRRSHDAHGQNGNRRPPADSDADSDRNERRYDPDHNTKPYGHEDKPTVHRQPPNASESARDSHQPPRSRPQSEEPNMAQPAENGNSADAARAQSDKQAPHPDAAPHPGAEGSAPNLINLFVRNVARHVVEDQLVTLFSKFGKVDSAIVVRDPLSGECRGFGFVKMYTEEAAKAAMDNLRDFDFEGRKISVERAKRNAPHQRTPGAYMGIDRRIRDRYAGIKRAREYDTGGYGYGDPYMRRGSYRGRYGDPSRSRYDDRGWDSRRDQRPPYGRSPYEERDRIRRRYEGYEEGRGYPPRDLDRDQRPRERQPPVPRESADDYI